MDLESGLRTIKAAIETVQALYDGKVSLEKAQAGKQIAELLSQLADMKKQFLELAAENDELKRKLKVKATMLWKAPATTRKMEASWMARFVRSATMT